MRASGRQLSLKLNELSEIARCGGMRDHAIADAEDVQAAEGLRFGIARGAMHFVSAIEQETREVGAVLPRHAEDQGTLHAPIVMHWRQARR
jgi:hypothetical protein